MFVRAYLRASMDEQDASRARAQLEAFVAERGLTIAASYIENESGAKLARPELFRLLADARPGDVLLVEQVDRLSRLTTFDWEKLKTEIATRRVRVVALDLPTSWMLAEKGRDDFTSRMFDAMNGMLLDVLAAVARKDFEDRRRRQSQGQARAKAEGRYKGRPENTERNDGIARMLKSGSSWRQIQAATQCSRATIAKIAKRAVVSIDEPVKPKVERPRIMLPPVEGASKVARPRMLQPGEPSPAGESPRASKRRVRAS